MPDQLEGQMDIFDVLPGEIGGDPSPARALKVLAAAKAQGWTENPFCSLVLRLTREDATPFYCRWDLDFNPATGKKSWRFHGARAANGQALNYNDIFVYLEDPDVIYPEPPDDDDGGGGFFAAAVENPDQTEAGALQALKPLTGLYAYDLVPPLPVQPSVPIVPTPFHPPAPSTIPAADWGALLS